jgi:acyl-CoA thioester hydrolase
MDIRIYYKHTDCGGITYHSNYIDFCEMARSELFFKEGKSPMIGECHFAVKSLKCAFLAPAYLGDELEVKTEVKKVKSASVELYHDIVRDKKTIFTAEVTLVFLCKGMKITKIDEETKKFFESINNSTFAPKIQK